MSNIGAVWQKWDLHIHTPASFHWTGQRFEKMTPAEQDEACRTIIEALNKVDVVAFGIMDYWTFDGFIRLRDYMKRHPGLAQKQMFPGIELRMEAPTTHRLNSHVLLSDMVSDDDLRSFVSQLRLAGVGHKPSTPAHLVELGRQYDPGKLREGSRARPSAMTNARWHARRARIKIAFAQS